VRKVEGVEEVEVGLRSLRKLKTPLLSRRGESRPMRQSRRASGDGVVEI